MAIIDIPVDVWNKVVDTSESKPPYEVDMNALSAGIPINSGLIGTTAFNKIFIFDENSPQIYPLVSFEMSNSNWDVELALYTEHERKKGLLWKANYISVKLKELNGYLDFDVNWADDYWLDENGLVTPKNCSFIQRFLFLILGIQTQLAKATKTNVFVAGRDYEKRNSTKSKNQEQPIKIGNITVFHYGRKNSKYERKAESWGVRGHWRHYKSGKSVFVKPFQKGQGATKETVYSVR